MSDALYSGSKSHQYDEGDDLPHGSWDQLKVGCHVMVQREGESLFKGEVDVISPDAAIFWVWLDGGRGRIAVYGDENTHVWLPRARDLTDQPADTAVLRPAIARKISVLI